MKRIRKSVARVVLMSMLSVGLATAIYLASTFNVQAHKQSGQGQSESEAAKLEGTWRVEITVRVCQTGEVIRTFPALSTYNKGGTMNTVVGGSSPARVSADYGIWRHVGGHSYTALTDAFLFNAAGERTGTQRVTRYIEFGEDADHNTANTTIEILDVNGNLLLTGCATATGTRMK